MRISSLFARLTKKLIVYNLFLSSRNIISTESRIAEQTNLSFLRHVNDETGFVLHCFSFASVRDISFSTEQVASCGLLFDQNLCSVKEQCLRD
jgi:hypothetical protein